MSLIPLLALPLVGGYVFAVIWKVTRYVTPRETGHRLYFRAIFYGVFLSLSCTCLHVILFIKFNFYREFIDIFQPVFGGYDLEIAGQESKLAVLIMAYFSGPILAYILNFPAWGIFRSEKTPTVLQDISEKAYLYYVHRAIVNNDFEIMMYESSLNQMPVMFTLDTRKVYVGTVVFLPNPTQLRKSVRIMPFLSGYRTKDSLEFSITDNYYSIIEPYLLKAEEEARSKKPTDDSLTLTDDSLTLDDFDIVISTNQITSCHFFDFATYWEFLEQKSDNSSIENE